MRVDVIVPEEYAGDVIGDLSSRRANIGGMETRSDGVSQIQADAPLGEMFGYATNLRNTSQGRGSFTMEFDQYQPVPESLAEDIIRG
jgi:elongation factor G